MDNTNFMQSKYNQEHNMAIKFLDEKARELYNQTYDNYYHFANLCYSKGEYQLVTKNFIKASEYNDANKSKIFGNIALIYYRDIGDLNLALKYSTLTLESLEGEEVQQRQYFQNIINKIESELEEDNPSAKMLCRNENHEENQLKADMPSPDSQEDKENDDSGTTLILSSQDRMHNQHNVDEMTLSAEEAFPLSTGAQDMFN